MEPRALLIAIAVGLLHEKMVCLQIITSNWLDSTITA